MKKLKDSFKKLVRELKGECIYCGVKLKIWSHKKSFCPKCGQAFA